MPDRMLRWDEPCQRQAQCGRIGMIPSKSESVEKVRPSSVVFTASECSELYVFDTWFSIPLLVEAPPELNAWAILPSAALHGRAMVQNIASAGRSRLV